MIQDTNTTKLLLNESQVISSDNNIISGKINPIIDKSTLDIISGGIESWVELWLAANANIDL